MSRKLGLPVQLGSAAQQLTPHEKPLECGHHEGGRWANLTSATGTRRTSRAPTALLQVAVLPYSAEEMTPVEYKADLPAKASYCASATKLYG